MTRAIVARPCSSSCAAGAFVSCTVRHRTTRRSRGKTRPLPRCAVGDADSEKTGRGFPGTRRDANHANLFRTKRDADLADLSSGITGRGSRESLQAKTSRRSRGSLQGSRDADHANRCTCGIRRSPLTRLHDSGPKGVGLARSARALATRVQLGPAPFVARWQDTH